VLIEAPADTGSAFGWVGSPGLTPPVALLGYAVDRPQRAVFAPFATFSPEWQAIRWANEHGILVEAIDLPLSRSLAVEQVAHDMVTTDGFVDPLGALAEAAGEPDAERWWDDVIEHRGDGLPAFTAVAEAMIAVREGTVPSESESRREAHMRTRIRAASKAGHIDIAVVCGAWHVPALEPSITSASADASTLRGLPRTSVAVSWVPWTFERLASSSGYGAGVRSPGWYEHVFATAGTDPVARFFVDAARVLRAEGLPASPDHLIAATRMAGALGALRDRPRPGLDEVLDAADTVMGGLPALRRRLVVGDAIGSVPEGAPQVPLARDIAKCQRSARLRPEAAERVIELDLRTPNGRRRSHLLHRLAALGVPWGSLEEGRGSSGTFRETWKVAWHPEWSITVVELSAYGTTLETAATNRLVERAEEASGLLEIAGALDQALLAALDRAVSPIVRTLSEHAVADPDVGQLMAALGPLATTRRYGDVRSTDAGSLDDVFDGLVVRALSGLARACTSLDADAARVMVERMSVMQHALALVDHPARRRAFPEVLEQLAEHAGHGLVHGRAVRLLHDSGAWEPDQVERRFGRALSSGTPPSVGAAFVEGFVAGSGTVLVHDADLLAVVDRWLCGLAPSAFDETIPLLRRTFGSFDPAERRQLGRMVAGEGRVEPALFGDEIDGERLLASLATVRHLLGLAPADDAVIDGAEVS